MQRLSFVSPTNVPPASASRHWCINLYDADIERSCFQEDWRTGWQPKTAPMAMPTPEQYKAVYRSEYEMYANIHVTHGYKTHIYVIHNVKSSTIFRFRF